MCDPDSILSSAQELQSLCLQISLCIPAGFHLSLCLGRPRGLGTTQREIPCASHACHMAQIPAAGPHRLSDFQLGCSGSAKLARNTLTAATLHARTHR